MKLSSVRTLPRDDYRFSLRWMFVAISLVGLMLIPFGWHTAAYEEVQPGGMVLNYAPADARKEVHDWFSAGRYVRLDAPPIWWSAPQTDDPAWQRDYFEGRFHDARPFYVELATADVSEPNRSRVAVTIGYRSRVIIWERADAIHYSSQMHNVEDELRTWFRSVAMPMEAQAKP